MSDFTIIIPVYNEIENLFDLENALIQYQKIALLSTSVVFVNDGSTDGSREILQEICNRNSDFHLLSLKQNSGLSAALKAGFDWVQTPWLGYMDSDLQTRPEDFNLLLEHIDLYDLITGIRIDRKDSFAKRAASKFANGFRRMFTRDGIHDTGCPLKVIRTDFAKRIPMFKGLHRFLPAMILLQKGKVFQLPVRHFPRKKGKEKFGIGNRIFGPLAGCFAYVWMRKNYIHYELEIPEIPEIPEISEKRKKNED